MSNLIRNKTQVKQAIDYSGLEKGKIYFSDIDGKIEIEERFSIAVEVKRPNNEIPDGQRLLLERDALAWIKAGEWDKYVYTRSTSFAMPGQLKRLSRKAIVVKAEYRGESDTDMIPLHECVVTKVFMQTNPKGIEMEWLDVNEIKMSEFMDKIINNWGIERLLSS